MFDRSVPTDPERFLPPLINAAKVIARPKLMARMTESAKRCVLFVHAPAGYGKTTAAAQWIGDRKVGWFSLDEYSSMPANFYRGILQALSAQAPECFDDAPRDMMIDTLQNIKEWPSVFVIDDFHLISDGAAAGAVPIIRSRMPAASAFLILSRNPPPEALREHVISGKVKQIDDLRFSDEEIAALFGMNGSAITESDAEQLRRATDGWAAALTAVVMSQKENGYAGVIKKETLNQYLKTYVFEYWERFDDLKKCSVCDVLNPGLCEAITGAADIWNVITALADKTGLVLRYGDNTYKFHALLREFLESELESDEKINKSQLYTTAARWYLENGDWLHTLDMAGKSGDYDTIEKIMRVASEKRNSVGFDIVQYIQLVEKMFLSIPVHIVEQYPRLSGNCFVVSLLAHPLSEAVMWADILEKQMRDGQITGSDIIAGTFQRAVDPRYSSWHTVEQFKRLGGKVPGTAQHSSMASVSLNFPFFHKGQRDYTDISCDLPKFIFELRSHMEPVVGPLVRVLMAIIEAGVRYERGELPEAEAIIKATTGHLDKLPPELRFCAMVTHAEILRVQGEDADLESIGDMIEDTEAHYLSENYLAFTTTTRLDKGDDGAASKWLERHGQIRTIQLYKIYQHFTAAKAMMVRGKLSAAEKLCERLVNFSSDYRRNADYIEALTLRAICLWRLKRTKESVTVLTDAIVKAQELELIMPLIKNGADVSPLLQKMQNRQKYGYDANVLDKAFINQLLMRSRDISKHTPGMFSRIKSRPLKLSPKQSEVIGYLVQNLSYQEISEEMGVTISAIDYHIRVLHEKFDVSNTRDLLGKAEEMGFID